MMKYIAFGVFLTMLLHGCTPAEKANAQGTSYQEEEKIEESTPEITYPQEKHLKNLRMLTNGGDNAEAYFSFDNNKLVLQIANEEAGIPCDQIFYMDLNEEGMPETKRVSNGLGRTTCAYFMPGDKEVIYASTFKTDENCPPTPERGAGPYVWPIYEGYDIYTSDLDGNITAQLTDNPGYDAEATLSPQGDKIVFTSMRTGDLELFTMNIDGSNVQQVTDGLGYDGGAFFSPDGKKLVFRASRPKTDEEVKEYKDLLANGLVQPTEMEIYTCNVDGSDLKQITNLGNANWAPFYHPSGKKILFSSNHKSKRGFPFNIFMINEDGSDLEQITYDEAFDSFPMFSPDGSKLVFSSNRHNGGTRATNVFIADWVD